MSGFSIRNPFFIMVCCLMIAIVGTVTLVRMPVDLFPPINIPVVVVATFYSGMPPEQIETNITNPFREILYLGERNRSHRIAIAAGREPDQNLFSAGDECRCRLEHDLESGDGGLAAIAAGNAAAGSFEIRCIELAGVPDHAEGRRTERNAVAGSGAVQRSQSDRERAGSLGTATVRRALPANHGVRRSAETCRLTS